MNLSSKDLLAFTLPKWEKLPDIPLVMEDMLGYVQRVMEPFYRVEPPITRNMIHNYVKWEFFPKPIGRKYERIHIAYTLVIAALKPVLEIKEISDGIALQIEAMGQEKAYNAFCETFSNIKRQILEPLSKGDKTTSFRGFTWKKTELAISCAVASLIFLYATRDILSQGGVLSKS